MLETLIEAQELAHFFCVSHDLRQAQRAPLPDKVSDDIILHCIEEIEAIAYNTELPALRTRCAAILREFSLELTSGATA